MGHHLPVAPDEFATLLRGILFEGKQVRAKDLAAAIGLTPRTLYARLHNGSRFDPHELSIILREVSDDSLAQWLFARSRLVLVRRPGADPTDVTLLKGLQSSAELNVEALIDLVDDSGQASPGLGPKVAARIRQTQSELLEIKLRLGGDRPPVSSPATPENFATVVRRVLVEQHGTPLPTIAASLGQSYHNLYTRLTGRVAFDPDDIRNLLQAYPEPEIAANLLEGTAYTVALLPQIGDVETAISPVRAGIFVMREMLAMRDNLQAAIGTGGPVEAASRDHLDAALRLLELARWSCMHIGRNQRNDSLHLGQAGRGSRSGPALSRIALGYH